jgi:TolB-like protein
MSFFQELKRRNVFRVGIAYAVAAWVLLQLTDVLGEILELPEWGGKLILLAIVVGFIPALILAWAFELTPEGVKRESEIDRSQSISGQTGKKLNTAILVLMAVAIAYLLFDKFYLATQDSGGSTSVAVTRDAATEILPPPVPPSVAQDLPDRRSIAVLPFTTRSTNEEDQFFSDGMHDDLLTQLAKISSLKVISRTSVMEYRETTKNMRQIGDELGVAAILEGAVQRAGQQVRINMQLIDTETDEHLWAETYDRALSVDNLFAIQSEIAQAITDALQATLSPAEKNQLERKLTDNLEALEAYRRAKILVDNFVAEDLDRAEAELRHALELDPQFAAAMAVLAHANLSRWWLIEKNPDYLVVARKQIDQARQIDPELPEIDIEEGYYHYWGFLDYEQALAALEPLLPAYSNNIDLLRVIAYVNRRYGRLDTALEFLLRVEPQAPRDINGLYSIGETYAALRRWPEAQSYLDKMIEVDPNKATGHQLRGSILAGRDGDFNGAARYAALAASELQFESESSWKYQLFAEDFEGAMAAAEIVSGTGYYQDSAPLSMMRGLTLHLFGNPQAAAPLLLEAVKQLVAGLEKKPEDYALMSSLCIVHGALGETRQSIEACGSALAAMPDDSFLAHAFYIELASGLAMGGAPDQAIELLWSLTKTPVGPSTGELLADPRLENLHDLEEWQRLIAALDARP